MALESLVSYDLQGVFQRVVQLHDGRLVAASVAVVGRGEDGDDVSVVAPVVALHDELVRTGQKLQTVDVVEPGCEAYPVSGFSRAGSKNVHRITCK